MAAALWIQICTSLFYQTCIEIKEKFDRRENSLACLASWCGWEREGRAAEATPGEADWEEEKSGPEQKWEPVFKEDAEDHSGRGKDAGDAFDEGIANVKSKSGEVGLQGGTVIFDQSEPNVRLGDDGDEALILALGFDDGFAGLGDIFFEGHHIPQFALAFALQFLKAGKICLRCGEASGCSCDFDCRIFTDFRD